MTTFTNSLNPEDLKVPVGAELDELDRHILHELQLDGRKAFRQIARELGVSERLVRVRVGRLQESGILRILGYVDPVKLGFGLQIAVLIRTIPSHHARIAETLATWPDTTWVSSCIGYSDIYVQFVTQSLDSTYAMITERLGLLEGVVSFDTLQEIKVHKAEFIYVGLT